ncbi:ArnT family glycosyltransferase [Leptospira sp. GIMC2001]|uniref:ArnT family glycosyltransferase n=1 Tax=Leptospira sp. GIMC2001 TaxID=1513297 RepID=UPI00234A1A6F|nr:glycosyltransferase family 39 protein [Leptospira sp. GIMC2001]WCL48163.1 glycosyltransferase family 39 protein [Leptospira sp. GIMC2001]
MKNIFVLIAGLFAIVYLSTLTLDVIDIDSSQYAEIVREMVSNGEYTKITDNGRKYLDKPILTFWTIAPFFKFLSISNWAFRLPSIIITFLSVWVLFKLVFLIWENERRAWIACLSYLAAPGLYAMVVDPKIDVYLTAYILFTHYFYYMGRKRNPFYFYLMYISMGLGFITKGPISMVIPAISIGGDILFRRDWKLLGSLRIVTGLPLTIFFPLLWSYFLYQEYSTYGPSFFLWIQSFGRFYKDLYDVKYDPFYFYKTFAWGFLTFFLPLATTAFFIAFRFIKKISFKEFFRKIRENEYKDRDFTFGFWLFLFLFLISFSKFQLPQYVYWVLPAGAILFSGIVEEDLFMNDTRRTRFSYLIIGFLYFAFILFIPYFILEDFWSVLWIPILAILILVYILRKIPLELALPIVGSFGSLLLVSLYIYPLLVSYQPASEIGAKVREIEPAKEILYTYRISSSKRSYGFYSKRLFRNVYDKTKFLTVLNEEFTRLVVLPEDSLKNFEEFMDNQIETEVVLSKDSYKVATPKLEFFLKNKRNFLTTKILLIKVKKKQ